MKPLFAVFINPFVKRKQALGIQQEVLRALRGKGIAFEVFGKHFPSETKLAGFTDVMVVGGDGTLNFVLNAFPKLELPISIISAGTGNDFARKLHGGKGLNTQIEIAVSGEVRLIDLGTCNGRLFHNGVGVGFDGNVVHRMLSNKVFSGKMAYYASVLPLIFTYRETLLSLTYGDNSLEAKALMATVANGSFFGGGFNITPLADFQDGIFDVCFVRSVSVIDRLLNLPLIEKGKHLELPFIDYFKTPDVLIRSEKPIHAHIDGEYFRSDTFEIRMAAHKLPFRWGNH